MVTIGSSTAAHARVGRGRDDERSAVKGRASLAYLAQRHAFDIGKGAVGARLALGAVVAIGVGERNGSKLVA